MAQEWLKKYLRIKPEVTAIFDDLKEYLEFFRKQKTPWGELQRVKAGKHPKDNWSPYPKERREFKPRDRNTNWKTR